MEQRRTDETMSIEAVELMGSLMVASHAQTMATVDSLHANALRDVIHLCDALIEAEEILANATVIDRQTERRLVRQFYWRAEQAERTRDSARRMLTTITGVDHGADAV